MNRSAAYRAKRAWIPATTLGLILSSPIVAAQSAEALPSDDARFVQVDAGNASTIALTADGSVYTWGSDSEGQLGDGAPYGADTGSTLPVDITKAFDLDSGHHIAKVVAGAWANYALSDDGRLWAWGMGIRGALGTGTTDNQPAPVEIDLGVPVTDVAAGLHFAAALTDRSEEVV